MNVDNITTKRHEFDDRVDRLLLDALDGGVTGFDEMLLHLPGVYPSTVLRSLGRLVAKGDVVEKVLSEAIEFAANQDTATRRPYTDRSCPSAIPLPVPHPLDYEWRFGKKATDYLLAKCLALTDPADTIVLVVAPSVLCRALERNYSRNTILVDTSETVTEFFRKLNRKCDAVKCDLTRDALPSVTAKAVVCDPPWYEEYVTSFLWSASQLCELGGHVLLSTPAIGTRPNVDQEWEKTLAWAKRLGLKLTYVEEGVLPYVSPPFERNALAAEGIHNVPIEWRRSNFAHFKYKQRFEISRPDFDVNDRKWIEESVYGVRIRFRQENRQSGLGNPSLKSLVPGDILPSVSRWDKRRKLADIWTSGNRVFACSNPNILHGILRGIVAGHPPEEAVAELLKRELMEKERQIVVEASCQLKDVLELERSEYIK